MKTSSENNNKQSRRSNTLYAVLLGVLAVGFYVAFIIAQYIRS